MDDNPSYNVVKTEPIDIFKNLPTQSLSSEICYEYNSFNPNKDSPPNIFLKKLKNRLNTYYNNPFILNKT